MSYALKLALAAIAFLVLGVLILVVFDSIWLHVGMGAALILVFGGLIFLVWRVDRKDKARRAGLDELPPV